MFTLIAMGVGVAYAYSVVAMLLPGAFPESLRAHGKIGVYFEAAAVITVLVLLGQMLELKARSRPAARFELYWISLRKPRGSCAMEKKRRCRWIRSSQAIDCVFAPEKRFRWMDRSSKVKRASTKR